MTWLWHLIPFFVGAGFGWFACALCCAASDPPDCPRDECTDDDPLE